MGNGPRIRRGFAAAALALLAACAPPPPVNPTTGDVPAPPGDLAPEDLETREARAYYAAVERRYLSNGLMRRDRESADAPFTARDLANSFMTIAFNDEYSTSGGRLVARPRQITLHRWDQPMRVAIEFGASVPQAQRDHDRAQIAAYLRRLARVTGHPIVLTRSNANHSVMVLNSPDRRAAVPRIAALAPAVSRAALNSVRDMARETYCTVIAVSPGTSGAYSRAVTVIRGELTDRMRELCVHEELAQSLGLVNDSPRARPSIFNDNEEFALLTRHDELLLSILYDRRLRTGMSAEAARPIVEAIAAEKVRN